MSKYGVFWSVFSCIRTEWGDLRSKSPYYVRIQENADQKKLCIWTLFTLWLLQTIQACTKTNSQNIMTKIVDFNCRFLNFLSDYKISGILSNVTTEMMAYCCNSSKITFGHYFKSIRDIENHFEKDSEIDLSFPIYGMHYFICFLQKNDRQ